MTTASPSGPGGGRRLSSCAATVPDMHVFLDICQGLGLAAAAGIRPFMPAIVAGIYATANWGVDFDGTSYSFLEHPVWLVGVAILMVLSFFFRRLGDNALVDSAIGGIGIGVGALVFAGSLADHGHDAAGWTPLRPAGGGGGPPPRPSRQPQPPPPAPP